MRLIKQKTAPEEMCMSADLAIYSEQCVCVCVYTSIFVSKVWDLGLRTVLEKQDISWLDRPSKGGFSFRTVKSSC